MRITLFLEHSLYGNESTSCYFLERRERILARSCRDLLIKGTSLLDPLTELDCVGE